MVKSTKVISYSKERLVQFLSGLQESTEIYDCRLEHQSFDNIFNLHNQMIELEHESAGKEHVFVADIENVANLPSNIIIFQDLTSRLNNVLLHIDGNQSVEKLQKLLLDSVSEWLLEASKNLSLVYKYRDSIELWVGSANGLARYFTSLQLQEVEKATAHINEAELEFGYFSSLLIDAFSDIDSSLSHTLNNVKASANVFLSTDDTRCYPTQLIGLLKKQIEIESTLGQCISDLRMVKQQPDFTEILVTSLQVEVEKINAKTKYDAEIINTLKQENNKLSLKLANIVESNKQNVANLLRDKEEALDMAIELSKQQIVQLQEEMEFYWGKLQCERQDTLLKTSPSILQLLGKIAH